MRKKIRLFAYYILPALLLFLNLVISDINYRWFGIIAFYIVFVIMFVKPLAVLVPIRPLVVLLGYRRELGHAGFWFFLFHAGGLILTRNLLDINYFLDPRKALFWGGLSAIGMIILFGTANDFTVKLLKKRWKTVQRLAYLVLLFSLIHVNIIRGRGVVSAFFIYGIYLVLKILEYKKFHRKNINNL